MTGTLNMAELAVVWPGLRTPGIDTVLAVLFVIAFSIKAGLFPLFFWLPASYHTPPAAIGAVFAGLLTKVGVYALMRIFTLLFQTASPALFTLLLGMSVATMVIGLVAALNEGDFRRILSFNLVGHIGYTTASLSLMTPPALAGGIFYVLHHIVVITNLFLVECGAPSAASHNRHYGPWWTVPKPTGVRGAGDGADLLARRCSPALGLSWQARDSARHIRRPMRTGWGARCW